MITVKSFEFNFFQENTYLVYDETGEAVLIDCGCYRKDEEKELSTFISDNKLTLKHLLCLTCIWITYSAIRLSSGLMD